MLPNLFILGAEPAGIMLMRRYLAQHPQIFVPRVAGASYFTFAGGVPEQRGPALALAGGRSRRALRRAINDDAVTTAEAYRRLYRRAGRRPVRVDLSSAHLDSLAAAARIRGCVPEAKLVAVLRNPIDRAYTKFDAMRADGLEPLTNLADAIAAEPDRQLQGWSSAWLYARGGYYHRQLEPYVRYFGRERLHVVLYEDLLREPEAEMRGLFSFAGVAIDVPLRPAGERPWPNRIAMRVLGLTRSLAGQAPAMPEPLSLGVRAMLGARYAEDIAKLEALIGRDLSCWRMPASVAREIEPMLETPRLALAA
jgi:hypothetical protein